ncbi:cyclic AMP-responsive element-binding protein 5-like isoform X4 [Cyprinus carpio]|uniref:Cyclic AMP-responsive element-binding protein 5-like isoform X4 n=1 Tax=Cyprinus carpio TaxID=7962 RepID=A0A9Q9Z5N8_CYPCA|nr:cyclic AMP-responsive element-binding protein 5-like isoform X4 [Cyprinus carpio]
MNVDQDRPYVCTAPGCSQRFQREDHLIIHRHKHEMTLKFPSIKCDSMLSDQTPTPTRFLRECEEVGLFTDLELNQPQVEEEMKLNFSAQTSGQNQPHTKTQPQQSQHHQFQPQQQQQCALAHLNQNQLHTHSSQPQSQCTATYSTSNKQSAPSCLHSRQTNALPGTSAMDMEAQLSMNCSMIGIPGPTPSGSCSSLQMSSTPKQTPCPQSPPLLSTGRRRRTSEEDPDERRQKFLERNRAAATRCRQKRKVWVMSLERKAEDLTHTNLQLQNEVTSLRTEVSQLKQILLAHKDCPVSVRQRETQSKYESFSHFLLPTHTYPCICLNFIKTYETTCLNHISPQNNNNYILLKINAILGHYDFLHFNNYFQRKE